MSSDDPTGDCSPCYATRSDGPSSCKADAITFKTPVTVWRGQTFQAENATLSHGPSAILCSPGSCSNDYRVGYIGPHATVTFDSVFSSTAGARTLIVYYTDGDACNGTCFRYFNISVNGGAPQNFAFPVVKGGNWNMVGAMSVSLTGFVAGTTNTITFTGDTAHAAPDLDWIEVE
jgi:hypothetical protein